MVKLRDGQRSNSIWPLGVGQLLRLIHHDVPNGPASRSGRVRAARPGRPRIAQVLPAQHRHHRISESSVATRCSTTLSISSRSPREDTAFRRRRRDASGSPAAAGRVQKRQVRPVLPAVLALSARTYQD